MAEQRLLEQKMEAEIELLRAEAARVDAQSDLLIAQTAHVRAETKSLV